MLEIFGISMKCGSEFRVMVKATDNMNKAWLEFVNEMCEEEGEKTYSSVEDVMRDGGLGLGGLAEGYLSNDFGYLVMEIEIDTKYDTYGILYYFDDYEMLDATISEEEYEQCLAFICEWEDKLPDNAELLLGDCEWREHIPDDIPWKQNV